MHKLISSHGSIVDQDAKNWLLGMAKFLRDRFNGQIDLRIYAYRHDRVDYLAADFDGPEGTDGFSMTIAVCPGRIDLELPKPGEVSLSPEVNDWVDALTLINHLSRMVVACVRFNKYGNLVEVCPEVDEDKSVFEKDK